MSSSDNDDLPPGAIAPIPAAGSANGYDGIAADAESLSSYDYDDASAGTEEEDEILNGVEMDPTTSSTVGGFTHKQWKTLGNKPLFNHAQVLQEESANVKASGAAKDQEIMRLQEEITNMRAIKDQEIKRLISLVVEAKDETLQAYKESLKTTKEKISALELELIGLKTTKPLTEDPGTQAEVTQSRNRDRSCSSL